MNQKTSNQSKSIIGLRSVSVHRLRYKGTFGVCLIALIELLICSNTGIIMCDETTRLIVWRMVQCLGFVLCDLQAIGSNLKATKSTYVN